jgi:hypothetical protein
LPGAGAIEKLRAGTYLIFDGFFVGIGYQRSSNNANYILHLVHWLDDLNNSSAINGNWFPGLPADYARVAANDAITDAVLSTLPAPGIAAGVFEIKNLKTDLWDAVIKKLFNKIADFAGGAQQTQTGGGSAQSKNDAAKKALIRMSGSALNNYVPLKLAVDEGVDINIPSSVATYFNSTIGQSFAYNSFWDKLVGEYAAQFMFAISPAVSWAIPIPFCGGLRWKDDDPVILADEYNYANFNASMQRIIESINVYFAVQSPTGATIGPDSRQAISYYKLCATYPDTPKNTDGLKLFKTLPAWLANVELSLINGGNAINERSPTVAAGSGKKNDSKPPDALENKAAAEKVKGIAQKFAHHWYVSEVLQQRQGELSGPLRFDIAPGSTVKIETPAKDKTMGGGDPALAAISSEYVYATIVSVAYVINAERATAGTSFSIMNTRTEEENKSADYTADTPPLYDERWGGGPLTV